MKKTAVIALIIFVLFSALYFTKPLILHLVKGRLEKTFSGSKVSLGGCRIYPEGRLVITGVRIENAPLYDLTVREAGAKSSLLSFISGRIDEVWIKDAGVTVDAGKKNIREFLERFAFDSRGIFRVESCGLSGVKLKLRGKDLLVDGVFSARAHLGKQKIKHLEGKLSLFRARSLTVKDGAFMIAGGSPEGYVSIKQWKYEEKLLLRDFRCRATLEDGRLAFKSMFADIFGGSLRGECLLGIHGDIGYEGSIRFYGLRAGQFVESFDLEDKFMMTGGFSGEVNFRGYGINLIKLSGELISDSSGGVLTINNEEFLDNIAQGRGQALNLLVESFKDYRYNTGRVILALKDGNPAVAIGLEGPGGRRSLDIVLHRFLPSKEER